MLPYVNNEHISNIYKILAPPYTKNNLIIQNSNFKQRVSNDKVSMKNIEKYYEYSNNQNYKMKKSTNNNNLDLSINYASPPNLKIIPNRKLSPINNIKKMIKI